MDYRLPYYMAYPMPFQYDDERMQQRDFEYLKSMYPEMAKRLLPYVEEECDRMTYEGSMIFDEYPDQLQIRLMCNRVYEKAKQSEEFEEKHMKEMVQMLVFQELFQRRCERRRERKKFYLF